MTRRLIRESALKLATDTFRKNANPEADQEQIVPQAAVVQRQAKSPGKYVLPQFEKSMEKELADKGPEKYKGHDTFAAGFEIYSEPDAYEVHPAMVAALGHLGNTFVSLYANQPLKVEVDEKDTSTAKAMANNIKRIAQFQGKSVKKVAESWLITNCSNVDKTTAYLTLEQLQLAKPERPVDNHNYNFSAGHLSGPFGV